MKKKLKVVKPPLVPKVGDKKLTEEGRIGVIVDKTENDFCICVDGIIEFPVHVSIGLLKLLFEKYPNLHSCSDLIRFILCKEANK